MMVQPGKLGWVEIQSSTAQLGAVLKEVIPSDDRYYDGTQWYVLKKHLLSVVRAGYEISGRVDYSRMPAEAQMQIAEAKKSWSPGNVRLPRPDKPKRDPYATLYLQPDAPHDIVKAVWRQIAKTHHPDKGGDNAQFLKFKDAYEEISK